MRKAALGSLLCIVIVCLTSHTAFALRCSSRIISRGDTKWHVQDVCGEPNSIDIHQEEVTVYKNQEHYQIEKELTIYIDYEIWRYHFNRQSLPYILIFRDQTLIDEMTEKHYENYWSRKKGRY
jgi:hypothetical protein